MSENYVEYEPTKEQTSMVEQALEYKKCERTLKEWAISFVDFKNGTRDEKSFSCDSQMLLRKIAINRANNIKKISEEKNGENEKNNSCFVKKGIEKFKDTFLR